MRKIIEKITGGYSSSAKVVDGTLVLSCPDAVSPVVWRMDLAYVRASALEVREADGRFTLVLKTPKEDIQDIAPFTSRATALNALMAVSRAMESAQGQISRSSKTAEGAVAARKQGAAGKWLAAGVAVVLLFGILNVLMSHTPETATFPSASQASRLAGPTAADFDRAPANATGVPLSAEEFLRTR